MHSLLRISSPVLYFQDWTDDFCCYAGILCFEYISCSFYVIIKYSLLYWQQYEHIFSLLILVTASMLQ